MPERIDELLDGSAYDKFISESLSLPPSAISYCEKCDRLFDVRSGCEADIRDDERSSLEERFNIQFSLSLKHGTGK